ncbi:unnamed protein product [Owenia fusiformis]|uniref:phospholipase A2 n=1 Tax=Owenia fusiformis TaxID=6347 RepID=A0A8J1XMB6_OWEFU|nr:unnamed protein product [Owenia fusiformis]
MSQRFCLLVRLLLAFPVMDYALGLHGELRNVTSSRFQPQQHLLGPKTSMGTNLDAKSEEHGKRQHSVLQEQSVTRENKPWIKDGSVIGREPQSRNHVHVRREENPSHSIGEENESRAENQENPIGRVFELRAKRSVNVYSAYSVIRELGGEDLDTKCQLLTNFDRLLSNLHSTNWLEKRHEQQPRDNHNDTRMTSNLKHDMTRLFTNALFQNLADPEHFSRAKLECTKYTEHGRKQPSQMIPGDTATSSKRRQKRFSFIHPGTKWCGPGDIASGFDDLGAFGKIDTCCRSHDHCPAKILSWETKYNVFNHRLYTLSHCDCDDSFRYCLRSSKSKTADEIGKAFFNTLGASCITLRRKPKCIEHSWLGACNKYSADDSTIEADVHNSDTYVPSIY